MLALAPDASLLFPENDNVPPSMRKSRQTGERGLIKDPVRALVAWVEQGVAPDRIVATALFADERKSVE